MLLCPVEIDLAAAHRFERAFHPERADVDMSKYQGDEQNGDDRVDDLSDLHVGNVRSVKREQQAAKPDTETAMPAKSESQ